MKQTCTFLMILVSIGILPLMAQLPVEFPGKHIRTEKDLLGNEIRREESGSFPEIRLQTNAESSFFPDSSRTFNPDGSLVGKVIYEYDDNGNTTLYECYGWDPKKESWIGSSKSILQYHPNGDQMYFGSYGWDPELNDWKKVMIENHVDVPGYSSDSPFRVYISEQDRVYKSIGREYIWPMGRKTTHTNYEGNWRDKYKFEFEYNSTGNLILFEWLYYSEEMKSWKSSEVISCSYNDLNQLADVQINNYKYSWNYDNNGNILSFESFWRHNEGGRWKSCDDEFKKEMNQYNEKGQLILNEKYSADIQTGGWVKDPDFRIIYEYDEQGNLTLSEAYSWDQEKQIWQGIWKVIYGYDQQGNEMLYESYNWNPTIQDWSIGSKHVYNYDVPGNKSIDQYYAWTGGKWRLSSYTIYYPNMQTSDLQIETGQPVGSDGEGNLEVGLEIPDNNLSVGQLIISLPNGITLNIDKTKLSPELAEALDLLITPLQNNSWLIELKFKELKRSVLSGSSGKILDIAYTVNPELPKGEYEAVISNLDFELNDGTRIIEESRSVTIDVARYGTSIETVNDSEVKVFTSGSTLIIDSPSAEIVDIYSVSGVKIRSINKPVGKVTIGTDRLSSDFLIVSGSSGWKVKVRN